MIGGRFEEYENLGDGLSACSGTKECHGLCVSREKELRVDRCCNTSFGLEMTKWRASGE